MNRKKKHITAGITLAAVVAAAAGGGIVYARNRVSGKAVSVYPVANVSYYEFGNETSMWGMVTDSALQEVRLGSSLVDSVQAKVGKQVKKGDCLMKYNKESVLLTIQGDEASIALLEAQMASARAEMERYQTLHPSEEMPEPVEQVIHHTAEKVKTLSVIDEGTKPSEKEGIYYCTADTKVTAAFLQKLDDTDGTAEFKLYEENIEMGSFLVDGATITSGTKIIYVKEDSPEPTPGPTDPDEPEPVDPDVPGQDPDPSGPDVPDGGETPSEPEENPPSTETPQDPGAAQADEGHAAELVALKKRTVLLKAEKTEQEQQVIREEQGPYEDWILGEGVNFNGDGTVSLDSSVRHYGTFVSLVPEEGEWDEVIYIDPAVSGTGDDYVYSRKELAEMVKEKAKELESLELDLKAAKLKLEEDKLISTDGKVLATMDGVITEVKDPSEIKTGEPLITIKGTGGFTVTVEVSEYDIKDMQLGDMLQVNTYETSSSFMAEISGISLEPSESWRGYGQNVTYYSVTATALDEELELRRGEGCEVMRESTDEMSGENFVLPAMFIRKDQQGSYCLIADENNRLKRADIRTGGTMWGSDVVIKEGLLPEDRIAFPYGKHVKEGSPVVDKDNYYDEY
ncbi:MAG: hypothetical protein Q4B85_06400 [Lachnospiraceae bacterium]|nr:hypothetical protein [Lachnospiraceae bacterium]